MSKADLVEQKVVAMAEQLGRILGTVQGKAEGWLDGKALNKQIASIRDGAAELLDHLRGSKAGTPAAKTPKKPVKTPKKPVKAVKKAAGPAKGRSGGVVDAPGKRHRKPVPSQRGVKASDMTVVKAILAKTMRRRAHE